VNDSRGCRRCADRVLHHRFQTLEEIAPWSLPRCYGSPHATELALVVTIVFVAAFMARGAWLF